MTSALLYHHIACPPRSASNSDNYVCPDRFKKHLRALRDAGLAPVVTIDAGNSDAILAASHLELYGFRGTFYIIPKEVGKTGRLSWAQIRSLYYRGHSIGNLTWSHPDTLVGLTEAQLDYQIMKTQDRLITEGVAEIEPTLAYPHGLYDQTVMDYLTAHGFVRAYSAWEVENETPFSLSRVKVASSVSPLGLITMLTA